MHAFKYPALVAYRRIYTYSILLIQWNPSKADAIGTKDFIRCSEVSLAQVLVIDHASPTIAASYDKALLWTTKKIVLMTAPKQEFETYLGLLVTETNQL